MYFLRWCATTLTQFKCVVKSNRIGSVENHEFIAVHVADTLDSRCIAVKDDRTFCTIQQRQITPRSIYRVIHHVVQRWLTLSHCTCWRRLTSGVSVNRGLSQTSINTLRPRQNGRHFPDYILNCNFLNENVWILIKISLIFFQGSNQQYSSIGSDNSLAPTHICVTRPLWVNEASLMLMLLLLLLWLCG